jgi:protein-tyrosine phosphatase
MGFSDILPGRLAMGSKPPLNGPLPFDVLVLTAMEYQPGAQYFPNVQVLYVPLNDDGTPMTDDEMRRALRAGREVALFIRQGRRVLVTCQMGRNRSGLVVVIALMDLGMSAPDAVRLVRRARGQFALGNRYFLNFIAQSAQNQGNALGY